MAPIAKICMLPAEFESATFHLGGERSILLSYGSRITLDFRFWNLECPVYESYLSSERTS